MAITDREEKPAKWSTISKLFKRARLPRSWPDQRARSWAREIEHFSDLPEVYKAFYKENELDRLQPFPYTVISPTFKGGNGRPENERLLWIRGRTVGVLEVVDNQFCCTYYKPEQIVSLERGIILLHAWITMVGQDESGLNSTTIRYNAVTDHIMLPFISFLRAAPLRAKEVDLEKQMNRFDFLAHSNFKFMSYGQVSIQPGARVISVLFQPQIRNEILKFSKFFISRLIQPAHLIILTNGELIIIRDDDSQQWSRGDPHGAIWSIIPRARIRDCCLTSVEGGRLQLAAELSGGKILRVQIESTHRLELELLVGEMRL